MMSTAKVLVPVVSSEARSRSFDRSSQLSNDPIDLLPPHNEGNLVWQSGIKRRESNHKTLRDRSHFVKFNGRDKQLGDGSSKRRDTDVLRLQPGLDQANSGLKGIQTGNEDYISTKEALKLSEETGKIENSYNGSQNLLPSCGFLSLLSPHSVSDEQKDLQKFNVSYSTLRSADNGKGNLLEESQAYDLDPGGVGTGSVPTLLPKQFDNLHQVESHDKYVRLRFT